MTDRATQLREFLLAGRNADGGWAYYPGKATRLEPTSWALIALPDADPDVLRRWPLTGELLRERPGGDANYGFHAVGLLALVARRIEHDAGNARLVKGLEQVKGIALKQFDINRQDNSLQGWSWISQTFSWAEPTAWALLALKKWARVSGGVIDPDRVRVAEKLLADRVCAKGGWNYGSSNMLGQDLRPYVPTTAVALLSLQDKRTDPMVSLSLDYLDGAAPSEHSSVALSLAMLALRAFHRDVSAAETALAGQLPTTLELKSHLGAALALCALSADRGDAVAI
jgi:hypothetical protein